MADEFQNLNIVIASVEDTGAQIKIRDQNRRTYSFFKNKKDGGPTVAYQDFQKFNAGDAVELSFKEVPYKEGTLRNVMNIRPATGQPEALPVESRPALAKPGREYWEERDASRQSSILFQVAFKAAVQLQASAVSSGRPLNKDELYSNATEFYDWLSTQVGEETGGSDRFILLTPVGGDEGGE